MLGHRQKTLQQATGALTGLCLDEDRPATLRIHPAPPDSGISFVRSDLPGAPRVPCSLENLREQSRWSSLAVDDTWVHHTEHILAALFGCGIDNALIELDGARVPVLGGGSCREFTRALRTAGLVEQDAPRSVYVLTEPVYVSVPLDVPVGSAAPTPTTEPAAASPAASPARTILAMPARTLSVEYVFQVPAVPNMRAGLCEFTAGETAFDTQLAAARTYYLQLERSAVAPLLSSAQRDYIILDEHSPQALVDEVAHHKTVDLLGDLYLLGRPLLARLAAWRTGHRFHHEFLRTLFRRGAIRRETLTAPLTESAAGAQP